MSMSADEILHLGVETLIQRGLDRDQPGGERSMADVVIAFNTLTSLQLSEQQGWLFMALVKIKRSQSGRADHDHYVDGANYIALAGEAALRAATTQPGAGSTPAFSLTKNGDLRGPDGFEHNLLDVPDGVCPICCGSGKSRDDMHDWCMTCDGSGTA